MTRDVKLEYEGVVIDELVEVDPADLHDPVTEPWGGDGTWPSVEQLLAIERLFDPFDER